MPELQIIVAIHVGAVLVLLWMLLACALPYATGGNMSRVTEDADYQPFPLGIKATLESENSRLRARIAEMEKQSLTPEDCHELLMRAPSITPTLANTLSRIAGSPTQQEGT